MAPKQRKGAKAAAKKPAAMKKKPSASKKPAAAKKERKPRPKNPKTDVAEVVRLATAAKKALKERGTELTPPNIADEINANLDRPYQLAELKLMISNKGLHEATTASNYEYIGRSNADLLSASADGIAFVVERDAKDVPTKIRDLVETYYDERNKQGVPFRSECFAVADNGGDVELTREAARASGLAKLGLRTYRLKPRHPDLMDDIEAADEDLHEKVKTARAALLARREHERVPYGTGDCKGPRPGLMRIRNRVTDGTQYVSFNVEPLKSEGLTYVIRPGTAPCGNQVQGAPPSTRRRPHAGHKEEDLDKAWAIARLASGTVGTGQRSLDRLAELKQAAEDLASGKKTVAELCGYFHTDEWKTEGHPLIDREIITPANSEGRVVAWLSAAESDFLDAGGEPAALFHVQYTAGALEGYEGDLELHEVEAYLKDEDADVRSVDSLDAHAPAEQHSPPPAAIEERNDASRPSGAFAEESASPADAARNQWNKGPAGRARGRPKTTQLVEAAADAATKKLLGNLDSVLAELASKGVNLAVYDLDATGQLSGDDLRVYGALDLRFATSGIDWRRTAFGPIDHDRRLRGMIVYFLGDAAPTPTAALSEMLRSEAEGMTQWLESRYIRVPTRIEFCVPADAGELVGGARGLFPHAHALHLEALRKIGPFDYDRLKDEVNRLAFKYGLIHALVERRLGLALPKNRDGDDFVRTWWELDYLISGHQATAKGLMLRPRHFAAAWAGMVKHEEIALYYGAAAFAKAAAAVFHPSSLARMNERGGL